MHDIETIQLPSEPTEKISSYQKWIDTGYSFFANEGIEGIQVERLARAIALNKSGFYHYFGTRKRYMEALMAHHKNESIQMTLALNNMEQFDPDFFLILLKFKNTALFQMQLVRHRQDRFLFDYFHKINDIIDPAVVPAWANFVGQTHNHHIAKRYFQIFRELMYSRITPTNLTIEHLASTCYEIKNLMSGNIN